MLRHVPRSPGFLVVVLLWSLAAGKLVSQHHPTRAVDLYQFWGIAAARRLAPGRLGSPYTDRAAYARVLAGHAAGSGDRRLVQIDHNRAELYRTIRPTAPPALYALFALAPGPFFTVAAVYRLFQILLVLGSVLLLCRSSAPDREPPERRLWLLGMGALVLVAYRPLAVDLSVGNINALQLALLSAAVAWCASSRPRIVSALAASGAAVLIKPNVVLVPFAVLIHILARRGARQAAGVTVRALGLLLPVIVLPCLYFQSATIWFDWARYVAAAGPASLDSYTVAQGNIAPARLLAEGIGISPMAASWLLAAVLLGSIALARSMRWLAADAPVLLALGVQFGLAALPLVWFHYDVLALLPILLLGGRPDARRWDVFLAAAGLVLISGTWLPLFKAFGFGYRAAAATYATGALPVWIGLLGCSRRIAHG